MSQSPRVSRNQLRGISWSWKALQSSRWQKERNTGLVKKRQDSWKCRGTKDKRRERFCLDKTKVKAQDKLKKIQKSPVERTLQSLQQRVGTSVDTWIHTQGRQALYSPKSTPPESLIARLLGSIRGSKKQSQGDFVLLALSRNFIFHYGCVFCWSSAVWYCVPSFSNLIK